MAAFEWPERIEFVHADEPGLCAPPLRARLRLFHSHGQAPDASG